MKNLLLILIVLLAACRTAQPPIALQLPTATASPQLVLLPTDELSATPTTSTQTQISPTLIPQPTALAPTATQLPPQSPNAPSSTPTEMLIAPTLTPVHTQVIPPATETPVPTTQPSETPTAPPIATPTMAPSVTPTASADDNLITIHFEPGAIATRIEGQLPGGARNYQLRALEGQQLFVLLDATNDTPNFAFVGMEDGMPYKRVVNEDRHLVMTLPMTQDYRLTIQATAETYFWLDIVILPLGETLPPTASDIIPWLATMRQVGHSQQTLETMLKATGQMTDFYEPLGLTPFNDEPNKLWFATVIDQSDGNFAGSGDMGIISAEGDLLFHYTDVLIPDYSRSAPKLHYPLDLTGDGRFDPLLVSQFCGAHTCSQIYDVLTENGNGGFKLISPNYQIGSGEMPIANSNSDLSFAEVDGLTTLQLHGGSVSSVGAGQYQRAWTDTWRYDTSLDKMVNISTVYDPSNYRFHLLHDANRAWDSADGGTAASTYLRVIQDDTLDDGIGFDLPEENTKDSTKLFAAFRMMVYSLLQDDPATASSWGNWIIDGEFDTVSQIPAAVETFWTAYETSSNITTACAATSQFLEQFDHPVGAVGYLGYQLPWLEAKSVCPVE